MEKTQYAILQVTASRVEGKLHGATSTREYMGACNCKSQKLHCLSLEKSLEIDAIEKHYTRIKVLEQATVVRELDGITAARG